MKETKNTKAAFKCYVLSSYVGTICGISVALVRSLHNIFQSFQSDLYFVLKKQQQKMQHSERV